MAVSSPGGVRGRVLAAEAARSRAGRNQGIDALRGLAVLLVVMGHIKLIIPYHGANIGILPPPIGRAFLDAALDNGHNAVFVFFVISGFVITRSAEARFGALAALRLGDFYATRFARIAPLLLGLLLVLAVLDRLRVPGYVVNGHGQSLEGVLAAALGLYLNVYESRTTQLPIVWTVLWSLSVEEIFYLGFPVACRLLRPRAVLLGAASVLASCLPFLIGGIGYANPLWHFKATLPGVAAIATGVAAALLAGRLDATPRWLGAAVLVLGSSALAASLVWNGALWQRLGEGWTMLMLTLGTAGLLAAVSSHGRGYLRVGPLVPLSLMGSLSYEIYLTHAFVVTMAAAVFRACAVGPGFGWIAYGVVIPGALLLGWLVAVLFTRPSGRRVRWFLMAAASRVAARAGHRLL